MLTHIKPTEDKFALGFVPGHFCSCSIQNYEIICPVLVENQMVTWRGFYPKSTDIFVKSNLLRLRLVLRQPTSPSANTPNSEELLAGCSIICTCLLEQAKILLNFLFAVI